MPHIENWEKYIPIPNLDEMDFKKSTEINKVLKIIR